MKKITLFWNNVCVLHKMETEHLEACRERLKQKGIDLIVKGFGLGYPSHMSEYLRTDTYEMGDIVVSTDLEIFEDERIFRKFASELYPICQWYTLKQTEGVPQVYRSEQLLPYLIIPLVFFSADSPQTTSLSLGDIARKGMPLAFGGINNSAAKSVVKAVWSRYGLEAAKNLLSHAKITGMPVQAYQLARTRQVPLSLVPLLFASANKEGTIFCPSDGAVCVPSYICVRNSISEEEAKTVLDALLAPEFLSAFVQQGKLISSLKGSPVLSWMEEQETGLQIASPQWLSSTAAQDFYSVYCAYIATAKNYANP